MKSLTRLGAIIRIAADTNYSDRGGTVMTLVKLLVITILIIISILLAGRFLF
ncbi:MAG TPA: hypothetical protein VFU37_01060 [Pyrinomonadaceae bacterium]|nr:hypothetical protein [Pyrinomonadaceae bacterium]